MGLMCRHYTVKCALDNLRWPAFRRVLSPKMDAWASEAAERIKPVHLGHPCGIISQGILRLPSTIQNIPTLPAFEDLSQRARESIKTILAETYMLLWKGKQFKGCFIPSKWKWYHRHGYWATRKKLLKFDTYRRHRYHEVRGPGKRPPSKWEDQSFYKPLRDSVKFW